MEGSLRKILTLCIFALLLGMTIYANRKKMKAALHRRVSKINHRHRNFVQAVGEHL